MVTMRLKATIKSNGLVTQSPLTPVGATEIGFQGSSCWNPDPGNGRKLYTNVANAIANLNINGAASIYITTSSSDVTAIEGAVTVIPMSNQD